MGRRADALTVKQLERIKKPGRYADGGGLYLQVRLAAGGGVTKSWLFRYMVNGTAREMGLGPAPKVVTLAEARALALEARREIQAGGDPLGRRRAQEAAAKIASASATTFRALAEEYVANERRQWKNAKHAQQWENTLRDYCYPFIGSHSPAAIGTKEVLAVLKQPVKDADGRVLGPFWQVRAETAWRVRQRIENILDYAKVHELREGENPARLKGHLEHILGDYRSRLARVARRAAMPFAEVPAFLEALRMQPGIAPLALEFLIHTATRTGEVIGARWSEINLAERTWTIPGLRMKAGEEHRVPLTDRAMEILAAVGDADDEFVFPGRSRAGLSNMAMLMLLKRMGHDSLTVHGFRSAFRTWAEERTTFPSQLAEKCLAHVVGNETVRAYQRGDLFEKRRRIHEAWSAYLAKRPAAVHSLHSKREQRMLTEASA